MICSIWYTVKNNKNKNVLIANYFCRFAVTTSSFIWQVNILLACAGAVTFLHPLQLWIRSRGPRQYSSPVDNEIVVSPTDKAAEQTDGIDWSLCNYSQRWVVVPKVFQLKCTGTCVLDVCFLDFKSFLRKKYQNVQFNLNIFTLCLKKYHA